MPFRHHSIRIRAWVRRCCLAASLGVTLSLGMVFVGAAIDLGSENCGAAGSEATPVSEATVDDVTITLITWSHAADTGRFEAQVALSNRSDGPVSITTEVKLLTTDAQGRSTAVILVASPGADYAVAQGGKTIYSLTGNLASGLTPERLVVGLVETDRSGARVEFPLNGDGASAIGGSGAPGGNAGEGTAAAGTTIASPAGATPASSPSACGQH